MKVLITGKNSYIGNSVKAWLNEKEPSIEVVEISLRNVELNKLSFKEYDVIFHVAGIAHISSKKKMISEYFRVNRDLAIETAQKAKKEGVKHFIFTSSMAIYGNDRPICDYKPIDINNPSPNNSYAQSKFEADRSIQSFHNLNFNVAILRIPMIYGKNSKGNFLKLVNISKKLLIFPRLDNYRSVLHIHNLSELVRLIILNRISGVFYPQDRNYFNTTNFVKNFRKKLGKKTFLIPYLFYLLKFVSLFIPSINKIYGNKYYETNLSAVNNLKYQIYSMEDVINEL